VLCGQVGILMDFHPTVVFLTKRIEKRAEEKKKR
jgi:hypothetical protein